VGFLWEQARRLYLWARGRKQPPEGWTVTTSGVPGDDGKVPVKASKEVELTLKEDPPCGHTWCPDQTCLPRKERRRLERRSRRRMARRRA